MDRFSLKKLEFHRVKEMLQRHCATSLGEAHVQDLEPSTEADQILRLQEETSEACHALRMYPEITLAGVHDLTSLLRRVIIGGTLEPLELLNLYESLQAAGRLKRIFSRQEIELPLLDERVNGLQECSALQEKIASCIQEDGEIADHASPQLAKLRQRMRSLEVKIREQVDVMLSKQEWNKYLQEPLFTVRGDRYVMPVKQEYRSQFPGLVHDQSSSGATVYMEPMPLVKMGNELTAGRSAVHQEEQRIIEELSRLVAVYHDEIKQNLLLLGEIDFILAKGHFSRELRANPPQFSQDGCLEIKGGRHPLLKDKVVPLDIRIGQDFDSLVITGPNTGGKTVALKTVGLLVVMAQAGLHIPAAEGTVMPILQNVFADIGDEQSIEQSLSTFSGHMTNIVRILKDAGKGSLVILDELGAGTDPDQGAALGMAILDSLLQKGALSIITSHYSELKVFAHQRERVENASVEFDSKTLKPTYRLSVGVPGESNAFEIAEQLGLSGDVIEQARGFLNPEQRQLSDLIRHLKDDQFAASSARAEAEQLRCEIEEMKRQIERKEQKIRDKQNDIYKKAHEEARELVRTARREAEHLIRNLREEIRQSDTQISLENARQARHQLDDLTDKIDKELASHEAVPGGEIPEDVEPGDAVAIPRYNQEGNVLTHPNADGDVVVQVGILKVNLPLKELRRSKKKKQTEVKTVGAKDQAIARKATILPEFDFRGLRVDEGLHKVDKYLDTAYLAGMNKVSLIHGKGTGALRDAVRQYLAKHPFVASYRSGGYNEGGTGVTIVEFK
ncbi:MAG: endonuclease MutS2 [Syntrophaceticus sp.]|nr:endonuclease MutS2 [Syntrophaceticus sp.]MDD4782860.1 endonuclease MutS2 [Syntrophaceticus sp.]